MQSRRLSRSHTVLVRSFKICEAASVHERAGEVTRVASRLFCFDSYNQD